MARLRCGATTEGGISLGAGVTRTVLQVAAPANQRLALVGAYIAFNGTTPSDKPAEVQLLRQTDVGAGGAAATAFTTRDDPQAPQAVATKGPFTTEPTPGQVLRRWYVHPQTAYRLIDLPGVGEYEVRGGGRIALRVITPATEWWTRTDAQAGLEWEEQSPDRPEDVQTVLSTELNNLATGTISAYSVPLAQAPRYTRADFELLVTFGLAPTAGAYVGLFVVPIFDGVNDPTNHQDYGSHSAGSFPIRGVTTAQRVVLKDVMIPPIDFKVAAFNSTGQPFPASGSTVRMRRHPTTREE